MLKERLSKPTDDAAETKRRRLEEAAGALRKQHLWGDLTDDEYRAERRKIEAALAALPARSTDTLVAFDEARARLLPMPDALAAASDDWRARDCHRPDRAGRGQLDDRLDRARVDGTGGYLLPGCVVREGFRVVLSERAVWDSNPRHED